MAKKTRRNKATRIARKEATRAAPGSAGTEKPPRSPYCLRDEQLEHLLETGGQQALLAQYFGEEQYEVLSDLARKATKRSVRGAERVLILPGIMGSKLGFRGALLDDVIWLDPLDVVFGNLKLLKLGAKRRVDALGVLLFAYLKLKFTLRAGGFDADFHPYDWRKSVTELGAVLRARIDADRAPKVHLVAHSMGGLVSRAAIKLGVPKLGRLVMLGTPNRGSFNPAMLVRGTYPILQKLAAFDFANSAEDLAREVFLDYPSVYELLPAPGSVGSIDLLDPASWPQSGLQPNAALLRQARKLPAALEESDGQRFFLVAGVNQDTVTGIRIEKDEFVYESSPHGDGTVPLDLCLLPNTRTYYVEEEHGALPNNDAVGAAVGEILRQGAATSLSEQRPALRAAIRRSLSDSEYREVEKQMKRGTRGRRITPREARALLAEVAAPVGKPLPPAAVEAARDYVVPFKRVVVGRRRQRRIDLELALGSLTETSAQATVLGIFPDVAPKGAAGAMDERLNGAITEATNRRMFGGQVGELFVLPTGRSGLRTEFVVFAGLGSFGGFSASVLETVSENVIRTLVRSYISDFATVLIGGATGGDIETILAHMIRGFVRGLLDVDGGQHFRRITLCEADPARYEAMRQTLFRLAGTTLFDELEVTITEHVLPAPPRYPERRGAPIGELQPIYLTLNAYRATSDTEKGGGADGELVYRASVLGVGSKATVIAAEQAVSAATLDSLLGRVEELRPATMARFGDDLAAALVPEGIREALAAMPAEHPLVLIHDGESSRLPWELLRIDEKFISIERGLHRRYLAENLSVAKWLEERRRDDKLTILLVVNPTADLDGAEEEGDRLLDLFRANPSVQIQRRHRAEATRRTLLSDFSSGKYDVIHYAGHAYFDPLAPSRSGILCHGKEVLSGADLAGVGNLPSLVFFNACEAGRVRAARGKPRPAAPGKSRRDMLRDSVGFAEAFLRGGVANYIGTYWPVGDAPAKAFATEFYGALLAGQTVGQGLAAGRKKVLGLRDSIDWADYIHYGNQSFSLKEAR
jgi:pimeloyl-ACP methyl ester carboxylesterase